MAISYYIILQLPPYLTEQSLLGRQFLLKKIIRNELVYIGHEWICTFHCKFSDMYLQYNLN